MKALRILSLGAMAAFVLAGCSTRNTELHQELLDSAGKGGPQANQSQTNTSTAMDIWYSANPSAVNEPVTVTVDLGNEAVDCGSIHLQTLMLNGQIVPDGTPGADYAPVVPSGSTPVGGIYSYTFTPDVPGHYLFRSQYNSGGSSCDFANVGWTNAEPLVVTNGCITAFSGTANSCGTNRVVVYTFTSEDAHSDLNIQGGLTNFTGGDAVVTVTGSNLNVDQWTPGNSSNRIISVHGSVAACETVTIHITWNSTNEDTIITGEWTAKDNGVEVAPAIPGLSCD